MKIEILGSGCAKCRQVEEIIKKTVAKQGVSAEVVHIFDINEIVRRGVMILPAVYVDGVKVMQGSIPSEKQIASWL